MSHLTLYPNNGCGFFSCCTCALENIIQFFNFHKTLPKHVDRTEQFENYKPENYTGDITYDYFMDDRSFSGATIPYIRPIRFVNDDQYANYTQDLQLRDFVPFINKYFTPSETIINIIEGIEKKYALDYENTCVLFYRGNDKVTEIEANSYGEYEDLVELVIKENPKITILLQSDEQEFIDYFTGKYPENTIFFAEETRRIPRSETTVDKVYKSQNHVFSKYFLAIVIIMAQCKYVVCNTGNCSLWIALYREAAGIDFDGFFQLKINKHTSWRSSGFVAVLAPP